MKKLICGFLLIAGSLISAELQPSQTIKTGGDIVSAEIAGGKIYTGLMNGKVEVRDQKSMKAVETITLPDLKDEREKAQIEAVDVLNNSLLITADDLEFMKAIYLYRGKNLQKLFSNEDKLNLSESFFISENQIFFATISHDLTLYDIAKKQVVYTTQPYWTFMTDIALAPDRQTIFTSGESGVIYATNIADGKKIAEYHNHTNNVITIAAGKDIVLSGGADKLLVSQNTKTNKKSVKKVEDGEIRNVAVSEDGKLCAAFNQITEDLTIFNCENLSETHKLKGVVSNEPAQKIIFAQNGAEIYVFFGGDTIKVWKLK
ncbi:MAG: WD40 repeat domain-containing protein [Helicobacteraceae bacterium]|jgi:WD40 repeat protein|nr:WD40 repeat domain-containing protein [Helicobacteraceae bacterium]